MTIIKHSFKEERIIDDKYIVVGATILGWTPKIKQPNGDGGEVEIDNPKTALEYAQEQFKKHVDNFFLPLMEQIITKQLSQQEAQMKQALQASYDNNTISEVSTITQ